MTETPVTETSGTNKADTNQADTNQADTNQAGGKILVLNGPNLGRLGLREPAVYGHTTHDDLVRLCHKTAAEQGVEVEVRQTDHEGEMLGWVHEAADNRWPVVLNPGAWTHYSIALRDACAELTAGLIEVHISNVHKREEFRHHSYISGIATGVIAGLGVPGYPLALRWLAQHAPNPID